MKKSSVILSVIMMIFLLVPIASSAASNFAVTDLIVTEGTTNYNVKIETFAGLVDIGGDKKLRVGFLKSSNGGTYTISQYNQALDFSDGNINKTLDKLNSSGESVAVTTIPAEFDSKGNLITNTNEDFEVIDIN